MHNRGAAGIYILPVKWNWQSQYFIKLRCFIPPELTTFAAINTETTMEQSWLKELPFAITVCDKDGKILEMNDKSVTTFEKYGGEKLLGQSLFECHPGESGEKLAALLSSGKTNCYTIEKAGIRKMIYQSPWFEKGEFMGFVELSLQLPAEVPHFIRS